MTHLCMQPHDDDACPAMPRRLPLPMVPAVPAPVSEEVAPCICSFCGLDHERVQNMLYSHYGNCFICEACIYQLLRELGMQATHPSQGSIRELEELLKFFPLVQQRYDALATPKVDAAS